MRSVAIHIDLKPLSTRAWPTGRTHKFIVDGPCRSNARCSRTMLVIFSSIVSVPELAAAQSFVTFTTIASRAGRTRAARCLLAQHPRHTPMRGHVRPDAGEVGVDVVERRVRVSAEKQLLFNELTFCSLWWAGFMRTWSLPRPPQQHPSQEPGLTGGEE